MPIQLISPDINFQQILNQNIEILTNLVKEESAVFKSTQPLAIYDIQNDGTFSPKLSGWKNFISSNGKVIASADFTTEKDGVVSRFLYFTNGEILEKVLNKISEVESLEIVKNSSFEIRILRVNTINLLAIWLHSNNEDYIYPVDNSIFQEEFFSLSLINQKLKEDLKLIDSSTKLTPQ